MRQTKQKTKLVVRSIELKKIVYRAPFTVNILTTVAII